MSRALLKSVLTAALLTFTPLLCAEGGTLKMVVDERARGYLCESPGYLRFKRAAEQLGYGVELKYMPALRTAGAANSGEVDGVLVAPSDVAMNFQNLWLLTRPYNTLDIYLYGPSGQQSTQWRELEINSLALARGTSFALNVLPAELMGVQKVKIDGIAQGLRLLAAGRVDATVMADQHFVGVINQHPDLANKIIRLEPKLSNYSFYTAMHEKHRHLELRLNVLMQEDAKLKYE